jgi:3-methyladenine DNA glycosylase/8-oxoguanine DNA glycosylase
MLVGEIPVRAPFPWPQLLAYLGLRLIPQFERIDAGAYHRKVGRHTLSVSLRSRPRRLRVEATGRVAARETLVRVARLLDVDHDARAVRDHLGVSPVLRPRLERVPGMRPPGAWSPFELCVRTILGQQVTVAAAGTLMRRLVERCGSVTPEGLMAASLDNMGMPGQRIDALRSFATAVHEDAVDFDLPWSDVETALEALPGFGPWTRAYLGIRLGRDPDAFPETDIGLIRAAQVDTPAALLALAQAWRPYRAYAATYLWSVAASD